MAELTQKERLQPSLLDRLTDDEPESRQESRDKRVLSPARLRECVRRDLTWLLNTTNLASLQDLDEYPEVDRSVVNFGMPDLAGHTASSIDLRAMERLLCKVIWDFEPRLLKSSVKVQLVTDEGLMNHNAMCFDIEAELWAQPLPLRLFLRTEIDLENGGVNVADLGQRGSLMDPRLLLYYNRELQYVRELGAEFAREFPKVAGRLGLETFECSDPYVERLLEGFSFMAARVHLKIDAEFPRFSQHLLEIVYPHYLCPTPSMAVVQLQPNPSEGALALGYQVPRGTAMRSLLGRGEQTSCEYRLAHDVTLWPLELVHAEYTGYVGDLGDVQLPGRARAALRIKLRTTAGLNFSELALNDLTFFLRGSDELPTRLYEQMVGRTLGVLVRPTTRPVPWQHLVTERPVSPVGFEDEEALLPYGPRSFQGYRLLHEYFAFPARFLFTKINGLGPAVRRCTGNEIEILVLTDTHDRALDGSVSADNLALYCAPSVNLFPRRADRIHLTEATSEYHVVPDRTRPMDFEVYTVNEVVGYGASSEVKQQFHPFFAWNDQTATDETPAYYTVSRQPRMLSARQRSQGARSSYVGAEIFLSLVDPDEGPYRSSLRQLAVETMCTNRDLPLHLSIGQGRTDFTLESGAPVESIRCLAGPTPPRGSHSLGDTSWRLISHLSLNYLSLVDTKSGAGETGAALRELLSLYCDLTDPSARKQIDGVRSTSCAGITRALPVPGPTTFGRGLEIGLLCDEGAFEGSGVFLLASVLERFFGKYVSINSFTETVLRTVQRGEIMRWPARLGLRQIL